MRIADLCRRRADERDWAYINGFENGDPSSNGEFKLLHRLRPYFDCFIDVGANHGMYVDELNAAEAPYIFAFEPNPTLTDKLRAKIRRGTVQAAAVGAERGHARLFVYSDDTSSSLARRLDMMPHYTRSGTALDVEVTTLDLHATEIREHAGHGTFIKIDVEGHELPVLQGAQSLLSILSRTFILFEFSTGWQNGGHLLRDAMHLLDRLDFHLYRLLPFGLEEIRFYVPQFENLGYCNYVAVKGYDFADFDRVEVAAAQLTTTELLVFDRLDDMKLVDLKAFD